MKLFQKQKLISILSTAVIFLFLNSITEAIDGDISGMVLFTKKKFLVIHDIQEGKEGARLETLKIKKKSPPSYKEVKISNWGRWGPASDLEAICKIPGEKHEFLLAEGKWSPNKPNRFFYIRLKKDKNDGYWSGNIVNFFPQIRLENQIEGLACLQKKSDELTFLIGERGKGSPGKIHLANLNLAKNEPPRIIKTAIFKATDCLKKRGYDKFRNITDLFLIDKTNLLVSSAMDFGKKGPFYSCIYLVKNFMEKFNSEELKGKLIAKIEGSKIEGLAEPLIEGSNLSIGSDDEVYGGIWRPLIVPLD